MRIGYGAGWAIDNLAFVFENGVKAEHIISPEKDMTWADIQQGDGDLVSVEGINCAKGYLAYSITFTFSGGRKIEVSASGPQDWKGTHFQYSVEKGQNFSDLVLDGDGVCVGGGKGGGGNILGIAVSSSSGDKMPGIDAFVLECSHPNHCLAPLATPSPGRPLDYS